jgi:hypothetical protein
VYRSQELKAAECAPRRCAVDAERQARGALVLAPASAAAAAYVTWRAAVAELRSLSTAEHGDGPADLLWEVFGEQGTKWFHRLGRPRPDAKVGMTAVAVPQKSGIAGGQSARVVTVHERGGLAAVGEALSRYFDGKQPDGLFAPGVVDPAAQHLLLSALDRVVGQEQAVACAGPDGDGLITKACLTEALRAAPAGRAPGSDGITYKAMKALWEVLAEPLVECLNEAFSEDCGDPLLTLSQRSGVITLIHKGGGKPDDQVSSYRPITLLNCDYKLLARVLVQRLTLQRLQRQWLMSAKPPSCQAAGSATMCCTI